MSSLAWLFAAILGLLCLSFSTVQSQEVVEIEKKFFLHNKEVVLYGDQLLKNNTLVFAECNVVYYQYTMNCSIHQLSYPTAKKIDTKICEVSRRIPRSYHIEVKYFQLKLLHANQVMFMWEELCEITDYECRVDSIRAHQQFYQVVNMSDCSFVEHQIQYQAADFRMRKPYDYQVIPHEDSFDLYFRNDSLCGYYNWCRQTQDYNGKTISGPVASHMKNEIKVLVFPANPRSPALAYLTVGDSLPHEFSLNKGEVKHFVTYVRNSQKLFLTGDNGYLGSCWLKERNKKQLNCTQFDSQGEQTLQFLLEYKSDSHHKFSRWTALSNLRDGGMLLLTSDTDDSIDWSAKDQDQMPFKAYKVQKVGSDVKVEHLHRFIDMNCNGLELGFEAVEGFNEGIKTEIHEQEDGGVCLSLVCKRQRRDNKGGTEIYLTSKCIRIPDSERGSSIQEHKECSDPGCQFEVFTPYNPSNSWQFYYDQKKRAKTT